MTKFARYSLFALIGAVALSAYPIYMGVSVIRDMALYGTVYKENFPKYIIPYTPIAIAVIAAAALMPLLIRKMEKYAVLAATALSTAVFFVAELLLESKVTVTGTGVANLESWQMFMCYVPPEYYETRTWKPIDILIGDYSPAFKLHFYLISLLLIAAITGCLYGFAKMIKNNDKSMLASLVTQSVCTAVFLGLCIFACFTAFYRSGEITVSPLSASLMSIFFVMMGVTSGAYAGSFLIGKRRALSVALPSVIASAVTLAMYIGEMILLSGHLYRFGSGFMFEELPAIVLAPFDILIILLSGFVTAGINYALNKNKAAV